MPGPEKQQSRWQKTKDCGRKVSEGQKKKGTDRLYDVFEHLSLRIIFVIGT